MNELELKDNVAKAALAYLEEGVLGLGTGSTVNSLIELLMPYRHKIEAIVPSSLATEKRLREMKFPIMPLNAVGELPLYIDGADEVTAQHIMIKGGGGAQTREKIIATVAKRFLCIVDESKVVPYLGKHPLAVEVFPMARSLVGREIVKLGGDPQYREGFLTDNGNIILDVYGLDIKEPIALEDTIKQITGVIDSGLFAKRRADSVLVARKDGSVSLL